MFDVVWDELWFLSQEGAISEQFIFRFDTTIFHNFNKWHPILRIQRWKFLIKFNAFVGHFSSRFHQKAHRCCDFYCFVTCFPILCAISLEFFSQFKVLGLLSVRHSNNICWMHSSLERTNFLVSMCSLIIF